MGFSACEQSSGHLPESNGGINQLLLVIEENLWENDSVGIVLKDLLLSDYPALPQSENRFDVLQVEPGALTDLLNRQNTILWVAPLNENNLGSEVLTKQLNKVPQNKRNGVMFTFADVWAKPQQVTYVYANSKEELKNNIRQNAKNILKRLADTENAKALRAALASGIDEKRTETFNKKFNIKLPIPNSFRTVVDQGNALWLRQDIEEEVSNVFIFSSTYDEGAAFAPGYGIAVRDVLGQKYVESDISHAYMRSDTIVPFIIDKIEVDKKPTYEARGLWRMTTDFMGGPFVSYTINDSINRRVIVLDGFVYAPNSNKRNAMLKLESWLKSVQIPEKAN
ncbi:MAG: DUF4837 family protein [Chitinophagales bacterium]